MYGKYTLFYESPKNWEYYAYAHTVCTRPPGGEGRPGDEAKSSVIPVIGLSYFVLKYTKHCNALVVFKVTDT